MQIKFEKKRRKEEKKRDWSLAKEEGTSYY
jgi:hypothetical protein